MGHVSFVFIDDGVTGARDIISAKLLALYNGEILFVLALNVMRLIAFVSQDKLVSSFGI